MRWLASSLQDLRFGVTLLRRDAGTSTFLVLVLALGIGGNAAIFTLLKAAFLDPLPYPAAHRLVTVIASTGWNPNIWEFAELRARSRELEQWAFLEHRDMQLSGAEEPERVYAARVTASLFSLLGVNASLGRTFSAEENQPGRTPVVVLSNAFWRTRMAADPGVIGRALKLDGEGAVVVGVLPPGFDFDYPALRVPEPVDIYVSFPLAQSYRAGSGGLAGLVIARLPNGRTAAQAQRELRGIGLTLVRENPTAFRDPDGKPTTLSFDVQPLREAITGTQQPLLWLLAGGAAALLLIACANTAQLLIARGLRRDREVAIRAALGASRLRLIRQFLLEGLVLSVCGGAAGLLLAGWIVRLIAKMLPVRSPLLESAQVDARVVGFTLALSVFSALIFSLVPAVKGSMWTLGPALHVRTIGQRSRWRHGMLALEAALSVFLLCGAGLIAQNLWTLIATPAGFDGDRMTVMQLRLSPQREQALRPDPSRAYQDYLERVRVIPGIEAAAIAWAPPLLAKWGGVLRIVGEPVPSGTVGYPSYGNTVSPDYFRALRIPLLAGRAFREDDMQGREPVAIVSQEFARRAGVSNPLGRQLFPGYGPGETITIVGVAGDVRMRNLETAPFPEVYTSYRQQFLPDAYLMLRSALPQAQMVNSVKAAIRLSNPEQAVFRVRTMDQVLSSSVAQPRFQASIVGAFALLAVAMAAAGLFSVISCLVSQRTHEIAIRMALGAGRGHIVRTVLGATTAWVLAGLVCGLGLGLAARNTIRALSSTAVEGSAWMYFLVLLLFLGVTLVAAYMPLRRAIRLDPAAALRCE